MEEILWLLFTLLGMSIGFILGIVWMIKNHPFAALTKDAKGLVQEVVQDFCEGCPLRRLFGEEAGCLASDCIRESYPKTNYTPALPNRKR